MEILKKVESGNCTIVFIKQQSPTKEDTEFLHKKVAELLLNNIENREKNAQKIPEKSEKTSP